MIRANSPESSVSDVGLLDRIKETKGILKILVNSLKFIYFFKKKGVFNRKSGLTRQKAVPL